MRRRILLLSVGMTTLVVLAFAIPLMLLMRSAAEDDALERAGLRLETVAYYVGDRDKSVEDITDFLAEVKTQGPGAISVCLHDGTVLGDAAPDQDDVLVSGSGYGGAGKGKGPPKLSDTKVKRLAGGVVKEIQVDRGENGAAVRIYLTNAQLREGLVPDLLVLGAGSLLVLLLSIAGAELVTRRLTRPLEETAGTAERLARGEVDARAPTTGPAEVAKVGAALNGLADRIDEVISVEREAVADLSHRLRTPLTALRLQVEALPDRERAEELNTQVNALERALTAVIRSARRPQREGRVPHCDATEVARRRAAFWAPLFEDQGRELVVDVPPGPLPVRAAREDLAAAIDALVENVVAHTPDGVPMRLSVASARVGASGGALLTVADEGPGIPLGAGERGRSDRGSTGLGLDIARRCAEASGGHLVIRPTQPHAVVELHLGAP
ncbi:HAMP domain-containing histidine kinase [Kribbella sp. NBC_01245]|uniref:sensor histidine kinase n=1 Tax=Kribbella sp. NBC_01245 TaxID=2903578 RepID=UPI002E27ACCA|nr:HAMP domain-containing sensor histidine kinase [Kribbella sp. NBC_01245]